jgi:hypothetical protein
MLTGMQSRRQASRACTLAVRRGDPARAQLGFGGVVMLVLVISIAAGAALFSFMRSNKLPLAQERKNGDVLINAKAALLGYAIARGVSRCTTPSNAAACAQEEEARPGELPCPDTDGDGLENRPCNSSILLGRLPWKTLGIPEPKDSAGETLWYALSGPFRDWDSNPYTSASAKQLNSDTRGNITVRNADGSNLTTDAVAVVFAAGAPFGTQNRSTSVVATCGLTNANLRRSECSSNYLESVTLLTAAAQTHGPFIRVAAGPRSSTFNDQVIFLTTSELMPPIEMRIGTEVKKLLQDYRANSICQCYPWADTWPYSGGIADIGQNRGRFPTDPFPEDWGSGSIPRLPTWLGANDWHNLFWYSVSKQNADPDVTKPCRSCSASEMLTVDGTPVSALFFTPGTPRDARPRLGDTTRVNNLSLYLGDTANNDGGTASLCPDVGEIGGAAGTGNLGTINLACDRYTKPTATAFDRNRLYMIGVAAPGTCAANAQIIRAASPCGVGYSGSSVNPVCTTAISNLDACPCKSAAKIMAIEPCRNEVNSPQCIAAMSTLQQCGS